VRVLASVVDGGGSDVRQYVWIADEDSAISLCRKGELKAFGVADRTWQLNLRSTAKGYLGSVAYAVETNLPAQYGFPAYEGGYKCNVFVVHRIVEAGLTVPKIGGHWNEYPPSANQWGNADERIEGWLFCTNYPEPGWVASEPDNSGSFLSPRSGHVGIVDFDGYGISAGSSGNVNRKFEASAVSVVYRKYTLCE